MTCCGIKHTSNRRDLSLIAAHCDQTENNCAFGLVLIGLTHKTRSPDRTAQPRVKILHRNRP
jgi:hypothetical protein